MIRTKLQDVITGNVLDVEFDLDEDKIFIDGEEVIRRKDLESNDDEFVYTPPSKSPTHYYTLNQDAIDKMKDLWKKKEK